MNAGGKWLVARIRCAVKLYFTYTFLYYNIVVRVIVPTTYLCVDTLRRRCPADRKSAFVDVPMPNFMI